jgi:hypothetical protein
MAHVEWGMLEPNDHAPTAVVLPGGGYSVQGPLLYWSAELLLQLGWRVIAVTWPPQIRAEAEPRRGVEAELDAVAATIGGDPDLVVGKSLGSHALPWTLRHDVPGVWLTPVLTDPAVNAALARAGSSHLAIGGAIDPMWAPAATLRTEAALATIDGADHSILIPGDWNESMRTHLAVMAVIEAHVTGPASAAGA